MYSPLCLNAKEMLTPSSACCTSLYILFQQPRNMVFFCSENILQWLGFPLKCGSLYGQPCNNADKAGKVSSGAGRVCFPGWQAA